MARVTVEDCIDKISNRFDLVLTAAQRARGISTGDPITVDRDKDKNPVVALREIADETISISDVNEDLIKSLQRIKRRDDDEGSRDEAASIAHDDMASFNSAFGADSGDSEGMQVSPDTGSDRGVLGFSSEGSYGDGVGDEGSFSDEGQPTEED